MLSQKLICLMVDERLYGDVDPGLEFGGGV